MDYRRLVLLHPNLKSYWRLDEASGSAVDLGPGGHDGTVNTDVVRSHDPIMEASQSAASMGFGATGVDGAAVKVGDVYDFAGTAAFTVVAWVLPTTIGSTGVIVDKRGTSGGTGTTDGWRISMNSSGGINFRRFVSGANVGADTTALMSTDTPYMFAGTYDGANLRGYLFQGGQTVDAATSAADARSLIDTGGGFTIGARSNNETSDRFQGDISDVAIYDAALPQAMLTRLHTVGYRHRQPARIGF